LRGGNNPPLVSDGVGVSKARANCLELAMRRAEPWFNLKEAAIAPGLLSCMLDPPLQMRQLFAACLAVHGKVYLAVELFMCSLNYGYN